MNLVKKIMTNNDCYKAGKKITPKGIMVHSLGVAQPNADVIWNLWNKPNISKCVHALIETNRVIQTLPWNHRGWHAGGSANSSYIGFEICEPAGHKYGSGSTMVGYNVAKNKEYFEKVWNNAVDLCVMLCKEYGLNPLTDIVCHCEGFKKGIASNHGDVMHWFPKHGKDMDDFRNAVNDKLLEFAIPNKTVTKDSSKEDIMWLQSKLNKCLSEVKGFVPLKVDGVYGEKTRKAVLEYWKLLEWNKDGKDDGSRAGAKTIDALASGRVK